MGEFDIYVRQFIPKRAGATVEGLERIFGLTPSQARELMHSVPRIVKHRVPALEIPRYERALAEIGAVYEIRPRAISPVPIIAVRGPADRVDASESGTTLNLPAPRVDPAAGSRARPPSSADTLVDPTSTDTIVAHAPSRPPPAVPSTSAAPSVRTQLEHRASPPPSVGAEAPPPTRTPEPAWRDFAPIDPAPPELRAPPSQAEPWPAFPEPASADVPTVVASREVIAAWQVLEPARWVPKQSSPPPASAPDAVAAAWTSLEPEPQASAIGAAQGLPNTSSPITDASGGALAGALGGAIASVPSELDDALDAPMLGERPARPRHPGAVAGSAVPRERPSAGDALPLDRAVLAATGSRRLERSVGLRGPVHVEPEPIPLVGRLALRAALGCTIFLVLMGLRHCQPLGSDVERALARWDDGASEGGGSHGLPALDWMRLGAHQFVLVDKDRVRTLVLELKAAGAAEVYVTDVVQSGVTAIARSLRVDLPSDPGTRKNVLRVMRAYAGDAVDFHDVGQISMVLPL